MGLRKILTVQEPCLHKVCRPVEKFDGKLHKLLDDMKETLLDANGVLFQAGRRNVRRTHKYHPHAYSSPFSSSSVR